MTFLICSDELKESNQCNRKMSDTFEFVLTVSCGVEKKMDKGNK